MHWTTRSSRPSRSYGKETRKHLLVQSIGFDGEKIPFRIHVYEDGTSSWGENRNNKKTARASGGENVQDGTSSWGKCKMSKNTAQASGGELEQYG